MAHMAPWSAKLINSAPDRDVAERVQIALSTLLERDRYLLAADANERSLSHRLALYLEPLFEH